MPRQPVVVAPGRGYGYGYGRPYYPYSPYRYGYYPYRYGYYPSVYGWGFPYYGYGYPGFSFGVGFGFGYPGWSVGFGVGYPGFYNPWYGYPYGPYPGWGAYYPYAGGYLDDRTSALRIDGDRVDAEVYIDGYLAGRVDDFDGNLQRLHLRPGEHDLTVYLDGYHTVRQQLYLNPGATKTLRFDMDPLGPGETAERPPAPVERPYRDDRSLRVEPQDPGARQYQGEPRRDPGPPSRFGTLSLRVQPADAEITIDGERWKFSPGEERVAIQLAPGRHRVEIRKDGYEVYTEDVGIRDNGTLTLNVSLRRRLPVVSGQPQAAAQR